MLQVYPSVSQLRPLCGVNTINKQNRFIISGFLFHFFVSFGENPLPFFAVFMRYTRGFLIAEVMAVQPFVHAGNGITNAPAQLNLRDNRLRGRLQVDCQVCDKFSSLRFVEMALRTAIFRLKFFIMKPVE